MNILYTNFHPRNGGGHATYVANLVRSFSATHKITVATPATSRLFEQVSDMPGVRCLNTVFNTRALAMMTEVGHLHQIIKAGDFDVIHVNGSADHRQVMLAVKGIKDPPKIIWTKHNTMPIDSVGNWLRARVGTHGAIGVSDFVSNILLHSAFGTLPIRTIHHGVDTDRFRPRSPKYRSAARKELMGAIPDDVIVMASVGGTDRDKGWLLLAQAIASLPRLMQTRVRLLVAGDPPKDKLLADFQALKIDKYVVFPGLVDDPERILAVADIGFVLSFHEACSFAACESLASGLPTLVSDAGGLPEVVRNGIDGWIVAAKDQEAVNSWLKKLLLDRFDPEMAKLARERAVNHFSLPVFAEKTMDFYRQICN